jgi:CHAT domain-containing protein/tetratricopeptide (TPR) repeat protein
VTLKQLRPAGPGDEDRVKAERLFAEGRILSTRGSESWGRALDLYRQALARWQAAGDQPGQVRALVELGVTEPVEPSSSAAIEWLNRALALARQIGDEEGQARALLTLADFHSGDGTQEALEEYRQAMDLWTRLGNASGMGKTLLEIALVQHGLHQDQAAQDLLQRAIPLLHQAEEGGREATALTALGDICVARGEIGEALRYFTDALALSRKAGDSRAEASVLYNLSSVQRLRGELQQALGGFEHALAINRRSGEQAGQLHTLYALGSVYFDLGDLDKAREEYEEALKLGQTLEGLASRRARLLNNIGLVFYRQDQREVAVGYFRRALAFSQELKDSDGIAAAFHNLGVAEVALGRPREGLEALRQALALRQGGDPYPWAHTLRELGTAYDSLGELKEAGSYFQESLELGKRVGSPGQVAEILFRWALLDREQGRLEEALAKVKEAIQLIESVRSRVEIDALRTSFFASKRDYYELYVDLLMRLHQLHPEGPYQVEALAASERARARGLLDLLAEGRIELRQGITPDLRQREKDVSSRLSWFLQRQVTPDASAGTSEQLSQVEAEMGRLESEVREHYPQYAGLRYPKPLELGSIRRLLDSDTALLEYFVGKDGSVLFVVTQEGMTSYALPPAHELSGLIEKVRSLIEHPSEMEIGDFRRQASRLYRLLVGPAVKELAGKHSLLIAPDGPLHVFPFEVLLTDERAGQGLSYPDLPYLLLQHAVSYVPSASVLEGLRESETGEPKRDLADKAFVAFANPLSSTTQAASRMDLARGPTDPEHRSFPPLLYSEEEVKAIARLFAEDQVELYIGDSATKENVLGNPLVERARRVHFATHGFVDEARPERSALVLTPSAGQDGYLTVAEIFNMKLRADLLVLSACETGRGKEVGGEGIVGLTRAFLYAGAKSLIVSLWPVVDRPTAYLMKDFYRSLDATGSKSEALRKAKLDMIRAGQPNPYLWAPFVLSGDSR